VGGEVRPAVRAVTFDFWDTLVAAEPGSGSGMRRLQIERFAGTLEGAGRPVAPDELVGAFDANWETFERRWVANAGQHTPADSVELIAGHLGLVLDGELRDRLIDGFRQVGEAVPMVVAPGLEEALAVLRSAGIRLGIVCDVGLTPSPTLRRRLQRLGLLGSFDAGSFSDETGWFKPAEQAYLAALEGLGVAPSEAAHVGDGRRTDMAGAIALGMTAIRFTAFHDHAPETGPEGHHVIDDHRKLPALLGVG
jgi:putative hydrolase of the HAD superfamily